MNLGFIGTGTISAAIVEGLAPIQPDTRITVSPRNAARAAALAVRFPNVTIAPTNQAVLDASDTIVLAVRPQIVTETLAALNFRSDHHIISVIPTVTLAWLRSATAPATHITRAIPLPSVAHRHGPTAVYPASPDVSALFNLLGTAITLDREEEFDAFTVATSAMSSYFGFAATLTTWMERQGVDPDKSRIFASQMFQGLSATASAEPNLTFAELAKEHETPGGLNEQVLRTISTAGLLTQLDQALDDILTRIQSGPTK
ncbi:pyrroline-5-carboxylate reductase [Granulicella tundricola]|uniref:NADP oxidoreductase coenzyme F420-dependent n=1 Tax=Granulicella tundricola (strain ATCC BAA-1859 / DSM 23138 / MP5ACTX9) TaxID=1198114 RepID=E8X1J5_GRATM|nr:pyrroline-5-carboxylate reductase [Granulicella tundricola]ADW70230.1 NADP oxidoreductase coenzyme F420-dependent [Granulicella tundricola MP5ACTX9]